MNKLSVLTKESATEQTRQIFEGIEKSLGMLPNLYAISGHSPNALRSYLSFSEAQKNGSFNAREREAVFLAVSEENGCNYCLSVHTAVAKMNGFSDEEIIEMRTGTIEDRRLNILTNLAKSLIANKGQADERLVNEFYAAGFDQTALIDLVALVIDKTFTNYIGRLSKPEIDFPLAQKIEAEVTA